MTCECVFCVYRVDSARKTSLSESKSAAEAVLPEVSIPSRSKASTVLNRDLTVVVAERIYSNINSILWQEFVDILIPLDRRHIVLERLRVEACRFKPHLGADAVHIEVVEGDIASAVLIDKRKRR